MSCENTLNRRNFISSGFETLTGYTVLPSLLNLLPSVSGASSLCSNDNQGDSFIPFLVFDMQGGAGLPGSFLVGNRGGPEDLIKSYSRMGWNPRETPLDKRFGLPMADASVSHILRGMLEKMSSDAQKNFRMASFCHQSQDDTIRNKTSALLEIANAGLKGTELVSGLGMSKRLSGAYTGVPRKHTSVKPLYVGSVENVISSLGYGTLLNKLPKENLREILSAGQKLTTVQKNRLRQSSIAKQALELANCGYLKNLEGFDQSTNLDPRKEEKLRSIFQISESTPGNDVNVRLATIIFNTLTKHSGPGAIQLNDCDYHTGNQTKGDTRDLTMGQWMGLAVETAHRLKKTLMFQLLTDGGVYSKENSRNWLGDASDKSMTVLGYYHPDRVPETRTLQVGHYINGQGAARDTFIGSDTSMVSYSVLANYLNVCGKLEVFEKLVPRGTFPGDRIDEILVFS